MRTKSKIATITRAVHDGWAALSGALGSIRDKSVGLFYRRRSRLQREQLHALYEQNALAARIVDKIVDDAFREGWELGAVYDADGVELDVDLDEVRADLDKLGCDESIKQAWKWSRLDGAALISLPMLDGLPLDEHAQPTPEAPLLHLSVIPAERARPLQQDVGYNSPTYGKVITYQITGLAEASKDVHHSRVIVFEAVPLPLESERERSATGWGPSILERVFDALSQYEASIQHAVSMMYIASVLYVKLAKFRVDHATKDGPSKIRKTLEDLRASLDSHSVLALDKEDEIGSLKLDGSGAPLLIDKTRDHFVACAPGMPKEIVMNESPAGLNAGELSGPQELWFATVAAGQQGEAEPAINRILQCYFASKPRYRSAVRWEIKWRPMWTRSDESSATINATNATADAAEIAAGTLTSDEVREWRHVKKQLGPVEVEAEADAAPIDLSGEVTAATTAEATPADQAMNGAQIASLIEIMRAVNMRELTYPQGLGALGVAFPNLRGREASVLGPAPDPNAPAPAPAAPSVQQSTDELPGDRVTVQAAAQRFGLKTRSITRLIEKGLIKFWGFGTHRVVSLAEVEAAAKAHEVEPEDPADPNDQDPEVIA